jgi:hypothetical protein
MTTTYEQLSAANPEPEPERLQHQAALFVLGN